MKPNLSMASISMDNESFLLLIDSVLEEHDLRSDILSLCRGNEIAFRLSCKWLSAREGHCPVTEAVHQCVLTNLGTIGTCIHAFHGCRTFTDSTYHIDGIKPLAEDWILNEIHHWAGTLPQPYSKADKLLQDYLSSYTAKVCAVKSLVCNLRDGVYGHALGSETLRNILSHHCPPALDNYLESGEPSIIEFTIPVTALVGNAWPNFVSDMLSIWLSRKLGFAFLGDPREGGIVLSRPVSASFLLRRHICDNRGMPIGKYINYGVPIQK